MTKPPTSHRAETARQNLTVGLHAVTEINHSIRYADTKAAALAAVQALAVTILLTRRGDAAANVPLAALFTTCLLAVLASAALLVAGQVPRLSAPHRPRERNRLAFPALATMAPPEILATRTLRAQHEEIWRQATALASIAVVKYRWLQRAMVSTFATFTAVLLWLALSVWFT